MNIYVNIIQNRIQCLPPLICRLRGSLPSLKPRPSWFWKWKSPERIQSHKQALARFTEEKSVSSSFFLPRRGFYKAVTLFHPRCWDPDSPSGHTIWSATKRETSRWLYHQLNFEGNYERIECAVTRNSTLETRDSWGGRLFSEATAGLAGGPVMEEILMLAESLCRLESTLRALWWWNVLASLVSPLFCWNGLTEVSGSWPAPSCW